MKQINHVCEYDEKCQEENKAEKGDGKYRVRWLGKVSLRRWHLSKCVEDVRQSQRGQGMASRSCQIFKNSAIQWFNHWRLGVEYCGNIDTREIGKCYNPRLVYLDTWLLSISWEVVVARPGPGQSLTLGQGCSYWRNKVELVHRLGGHCWMSAWLFVVSVLLDGQLFSSHWWYLFRRK